MGVAGIASVDPRRYVVSSKRRPRFQRITEAESLNIEQLFNELIELSRSLSEEQHRHVREHMTEEELVIFDISTRPGPDLSADERAEVKKGAKQLLERLKELLAHISVVISSLRTAIRPCSTP